MVIDLPWPRGVSAQNRGSWRNKSKPTSDLRLIAKMICLDLLARGGKPIPGPHVIHYTFFVEDMRQRDRANMIQQCKPLIDGVVDSGVIDGDHWEISWIGAVEVVYRAKKPGVRLEILPK